MLRVLICIFLTITAFVFEGTVFNFISFGSVVPNILLILTVSIGMLRGRKAGLLTGLFAGFLLDVFVGDVLGFHALVLMYLGYVNGCFNHLFYPEDVKLPLGSIVLSDLIYNFVMYVFLFLLRGKLNIGYYFMHIFVPECVYTAFITIFIYPFLLWIDKLLTKGEKARARKFV